MTSHEMTVAGFVSSIRKGELTVGELQARLARARQIRRPSRTTLATIAAEEEALRQIRSLALKAVAARNNR